MNIIFAGTIGRSGLGGQAWASLQYLLGFRALGHEVLYLEDCGQCSYVFNWEKAEWTYELDYPAGYVRQCLEPFGFGNQWVYRTDDDFRGLAPEAYRARCAAADLIIMRAVPFWNWRPEYDQARRRVFIDVDPGFTQIAMATTDTGLADCIGRAERRFTYGWRIGAPDCPIPQPGGAWLKTVPPVFLPEWPVVVEAADYFTSVVRWQGFKEVSYNGVVYGQRDKEFSQYFELPRLTRQPFRIAQMGVKPELLQGYGWDVVPGEVVSSTPASYRQFIQQSRAEFSVPKHGYVKMRGGWFSDRSVCYLASGRPVLMADTGLSEWLPAGQGLVLFSNPEEARAAVEAINRQYSAHREAARRLAENYFATDRVLPALLESAMN